ncbi:MAG: polysaccharide deacetylase family protein [Candidatus Choladocola sp.]|nr:polysaccharide deacetylase family protein [Candidatus Choladocola sp.]
MRKKKQWAVLLFAAFLVLGSSGCSRSVLNYQLAECIGTLEQYENNEPVETPKMKAEREQRESEEALESEKTEVLEEASLLAQGYEYEAAISLLQNTQALQDDTRAAEAIAEYEKGQETMYEYEGDIGHLCFTGLVTDTTRAFDGDEYSGTYRSNLITLTEFQNILEELYKSGYILIDIHSLAEETEDDRGNVTLTSKNPYIPQGRKPIIISVDNLNYSSVRNGDGVATKLALDDNGNVAAVYTDEGGHDLLGAYDIVPVLEQFIEEHPDFSFRGARGIISLSGAGGAFGYSLEQESSSYEENAEKVRQIAEKLKEDGWTFASSGYSYQYMRDLSYDALKSDMEQWQQTVGSLIGACDTLMYPYGSEVDYTTEKGAYLVNQGFRYMIGMWSDGDHREVNETYLRQTRRMVTGYIFDNYPNNYATYFQTSAILDPNR